MLIKFEVNMELPAICFLCLLSERYKEVTDAVRGKCRLAKDAHDFEYGPADLKVMLDDGNETVGDDSDMYLNADCIFGFSPEAFDLKVLLDPLEEQLNLPPVFVKQGNVLRTKEEVVRVVYETAMEFRSIIDNPSDDSRVLLLVLSLRETDALVFEHVACSGKDTFSIDNLVCWLALFPDNEECAEGMNLIKSGEVKVASVKHIARQRLVGEPVHGVDIMDLCVSDSVEYRNLRGDVNLGVDSDARLGAAELCPLEYGQAKVDGRGVDGVEPAMQLKLLRDTFGLGNCDHVKGKLLKDAMVSENIGLRQHLSVDGLMAKAEVFGLPTMGGRYIRKFPEAPAAHELAKHQNQQMVPVRHRPACGPVVVFGEYAPELPLRKELYYLRKNEFPCMHICSGFESDAKVSISKPGQGNGGLKRCA